jgi:hypothetical protein
VAAVKLVLHSVNQKQARRKPSGTVALGRILKAECVKLPSERCRGNIPRLDIGLSELIAALITAGVFLAATLICVSLNAIAATIDALTLPPIETVGPPFVPCSAACV